MFITLFYIKRVSQERGYRVIAELTVFLVPLPHPRIQVGAQLVEALLQVGRSRARCPMVSLEFFIDVILPATL
jgi:hypothetical protein